MKTIDYKIIQESQILSEYRILFNTFRESLRGLNHDEILTACNIAIGSCSHCWEDSSSCQCWNDE